MAKEKEATKLYKVRNGYAVMKGNQAIKEGNVALTDKEYALQSWKVEAIAKEEEGTTEPSQLSDTVKQEEDVKDSNADRAVKKSRFNRVVKSPK